ncbi:MAG: acyl-CoA thioesterase [Clostridia bacterium]|nr:acyl-CoA thioesterase [Clostridia bacterium]
MTYTYTRKAHYHETDQMGIIHHSNYIKWFEEARIAYLNDIGLPYSKMEEDGVLIPVLNVSCDYLSMVRFDDDVVIYVSIEAYTGARLAMKYTVKDKTGKIIYAKGVSKHCFLNKEKKPIRLFKVKPKMAEVFEKLI